MVPGAFLLPPALTDCLPQPWGEKTTQPKIETQHAATCLLTKPSRLFTASPFIFHRVERFICSEATNEKKRTGDLNNTQTAIVRVKCFIWCEFLWLGHFSPNLLLVWRCIVFCGQAKPGDLVNVGVHAGLHTLSGCPSVTMVDYYGKIEVHGLRWYTNNLISLPKPRPAYAMSIHSNAQLRKQMQSRTLVFCLLCEWSHWKSLGLPNIFSWINW